MAFSVYRTPIHYFRLADSVATACVSSVNCTNFNRFEITSDCCHKSRFSFVDSHYRQELLQRLCTDYHFYASHTIWWSTINSPAVLWFSETCLVIRILLTEVLIATAVSAERYFRLQKVCVWVADCLSEISLSIHVPCTFTYSCWIGQMLYTAFWPLVHPKYAFVKYYEKLNYSKCSLNDAHHYGIIQYK